MIKFERQENSHHDDNGEVYQGIDIIMVTDHEKRWICECGNWNDRQAHIYADFIINALEEKLGEF